MSSPQLGVVRNSTLTNPLLIKPPLGQTRSRGLSGPGPDFTFGSSSSSLRDGGVAEALSSWGVQPRRADSARPVALDFVSLNRDAVKSGVVTSKELSQYRAQVGRTRSQNPAPKQQRGRTSGGLAVPDVTFGVKTRTPSPLSDLLSHQYARLWQDEHLRNQTSNCTHLQRTNPRCIPDTRTSLLRRSRAPPVSQTPVRLQHFTQVPPALNTFREQEDRVFRVHQSHLVSRRRVQDLD
uniref:cilia- and flagella-associated protein 77 n=1 Tax=Scatophagus argus TaxID=75038 RepID=UPI001ED81224|nr:cilia- and flagella-associated protein 77 [Scatophagus argus]